MGLTASIDIELEKQLDGNFFETEVLLNNWGFNDYDSISYIPLNESDFEWIKVPFSEKERVMKEIVNKLNKNEVVGIILTLNESNIGGQLIYFPNRKMISFNININRITLPSGKTDFEWYENNFEKMFEKYNIKSINHTEY